MHKQTLELEIAHVLFIDIVGYSRLAMAEQTQSLAELQELVRATPEFRHSESDNLICLPTGDGMALVFFRDPVGPVQCARQVARAVRDQSRLQLRMGVHTGPVYRVHDINLNLNVSGGGINLAQRVMDCGDAGHILLSRPAADLLRQVGSWPLHDLGEFEVKHGERLHLYNLHGDDFGNPNAPSRLRHASPTLTVRPSSRMGSVVALAAIATVIIAVGVWTLRSDRAGPSASNAGPKSGAMGSPRKESRISNQDREQKSIAVLPFVNMSSDKEDEYFSDGMTEELIAALARVRELRVPARTSVFAFKGKTGDIRQIGKALNVQTVLEGSVRRSGTRLRITAQLINVADDRHLWTETYENREMKDVFAVQDDVARKIVDALQVRLAARPNTPLVKRGTKNPQAHELYLKGLYHLQRDSEADAEKTLSAFEKAIQIDPNYAQAYVGLGDYYWLKNTPSDGKAHEKARTALQTALRLDPTLAGAHASLGGIKLWRDWDFSGAEREFRRAFELDPNDVMAHHVHAHFLMVMERLEEAIVEMQECVIRLDPLSLSANTSLGAAFLHARQHDRAIAQFRKVLDLEPDDARARNYLAWAYLLKKMYPEAIAESDKASRVSGDDNHRVLLVGLAFALSGRKAEARKMLNDLLKRREAKRGYVPAVGIATLFMALGEEGPAFAWLETGYREREDNILSLSTNPLLSTNPFWNEYRSDPRYQALMKKVGLPGSASPPSVRR